jgi:hypothetical protein
MNMTQGRAVESFKKWASMQGTEPRRPNRYATPHIIPSSAVGIMMPSQTTNPWFKYPACYTPNAMPGIKTCRNLPYPASPQSSPNVGYTAQRIGSSGAAARDAFEKRKSWEGGRYTIISGISIKPSRKQLAKASTTLGSKSVPLAFKMLSLASSGDIALRYGRSLVRAS